ncbi:MAG: PilZ domain-containing protein [Planctomycetota bacterium]|nr:MAG: PilZ domain-containing protein [Planctomycetota bacterium]
MLERRMSPRIGTNLEVRYSHYQTKRKKRSRTTTIYTKGEKAIARALDISCGGLLLETVQYMDDESLMEMAICLGNTTIRATGKVVHCQEDDGKFLLGIKFLNMREEHRRLLYSFIASKMESYYAPAPA